MVDPDSLRHDLYRDLYLSERDRRERICASAGLPIVALGLAVLALAAVVARVDPAGWHEPATAAGFLLLAAALACVVVAGVNLARMERRTPLSQLPGLDDLRAIEGSTRRLIAESGRDDRALIADHFRDRLTATYFNAFRQQQRSNGQSAANRAVALRFVVWGLLLVAVSTVLVPLLRLIAG